MGGLRISLMIYVAASFCACYLRYTLEIISCLLLPTTSVDLCIQTMSFEHSDL